MSDEKNLEEKVEATPELVETTTETSQEEAQAAEEKKEEVVIDRGPHDDFDWSIGKQRIIKYTDEETAKYIADYEESLKTLNENVVVTGRVTSFSSGDVVLDINHKSDGLVSASEFRDMPDLAVGE